MNKKPKVRAIAFYLPQFYPTSENDEWWGKGFTEWTNVGKSKPLFRGHYQPRVPTDLGYYDLRLPEVREQQAILAQKAGIEGFCYWHYWFNGRRLLSRIFHEVVNSGKPIFPFCLCWANHSWRAVGTAKDTKSAKLLMEQTYGGIDDYTAHFYAMLPAFKDHRYIKIDGRLSFGFFDTNFNDFPCFKKTWNELAEKEGIPHFFFWGLCQQTTDIPQAIKNGFEHIVEDTLAEAYQYADNRLRRKWGYFKRDYFHLPYVVNYKKYVDYTISVFKNNLENTTNLIPCIAPGFDHSPRSRYHSIIFDKNTPEEWGRVCSNVISLLQKSKREKILFIKAWNEWGEGNYLEPDIRYGNAFLEELEKHILE